MAKQHDDGPIVMLRYEVTIRVVLGLAFDHDDLALTLLPDGPHFRRIVSQNVLEYLSHWCDPTNMATVEEFAERFLDQIRQVDPLCE